MGTVNRYDWFFLAMKAWSMETYFVYFDAGLEVRRREGTLLWVVRTKYKVIST